MAPHEWVHNRGALAPAQGGYERLSGKQSGDSSGADKKKTRPARNMPKHDPKSRKQRAAGDVGRALRSIYDDTLREPVPTDFTDLLGKLS